MQDKATWVAFNLPAGVVMTLVDHYVSGGPNGFGDLKDAGKVVDLIGTGKTEAVDLSRCNMNDCVSAFFWRNVDLEPGRDRAVSKTWTSRAIGPSCSRRNGQRAR